MNKPNIWQQISNWWRNFKHKFGHDFSQWSDPKKATRTFVFNNKSVKIDVQTRVCQVCNYMQSQEISTS